MNYLKNKGLTLIELIVVVLILGVLSSFIFPSYIYLKNNTKKTAVLSQLMPIHSLFKLNYRYKGHYGGVDISDIQLPEHYCGILILTPKNCSSSNPWHIKGSCSKPNIKQHFVNSGFMIIAYGEKNSLDISLNYKKEIFREKIFDSEFNFTTEFELELQKLLTCESYSKREDCLASGCEWDGSACNNYSAC